jgi:beta-mannosidase
MYWSGHQQSHRLIESHSGDSMPCTHLNGQLVLQADNQFLEHCVEVSHQLKSEENVLEIVFESARKRSWELVE